METNEATAVTAAAPQQSTELAPVDRARLALNAPELETLFTELASEARMVTVITNGDGYKDAQSCRMSIKRERIALERNAKTVRDSANAFAKAVIGEEKRLIAITAPEETRLQELQTEYDERAEREKRETEQRETARVKAITDAITELFKAGAFQSDEKSTALSKRLATLNARVLDPAVFAERFDEAKTVHAGAVAQLREARNAAVAREQEAIETAAKLAEFETMKAQNAALLKEKQDRDERDAAIAKVIADWDDAHAENLAFDRQVYERNRSEPIANPAPPTYRDETHTNPAPPQKEVYRDVPGVGRTFAGVTSSLADQFEIAIGSGDLDAAALIAAKFVNPSAHLKAMERVNMLRQKSKDFENAKPGDMIVFPEGGESPPPRQSVTPEQAAALRARWKAAAKTTANSALCAIVDVCDGVKDDDLIGDFEAFMWNIRDIAVGTLVRGGYNESEFML